MLDPNQCLRVRDEEIAAKVIDGEAIVINLANGIYYSMDQVGAFIWEMVQEGHTIKGIIRAVVSRFDTTWERAEADVKRLLEDLLKENLVCFSDHTGPSARNGPDSPLGGLPYESPKLNIYRDMGDLLALDPPSPGLGDMTWKEAEEDLS